MWGNLISYRMEQFSKLIFVRETLIHQPYEECENSNNDIEERFSQPVIDLYGIFCTLS